MNSLTLSPLSVIGILGLWILSVQTALADSCSEDPSNCTPAQLCEKSTEVIDGIRYWLANPDDPYLLVAEKYGLNCKAQEPLSSCERDPAQCTILELCEIATSVTDGTTTWNENRKAHQQLAASYDLTCDVTASNAEISTEPPANIALVEKPSESITTSNILPTKINKRTINLLQPNLLNPDSLDWTLGSTNYSSSKDDLIDYVSLQWKYWSRDRLLGMNRGLYNHVNKDKWLTINKVLRVHGANFDEPYFEWIGRYSKTLMERNEFIGLIDWNNQYARLAGHSEKDIQAFRERIIEVIREYTSGGIPLLGHVGWGFSQSDIQGLNGIIIDLPKEKFKAPYSDAELLEIQEMYRIAADTLIAPQVVGVRAYAATINDKSRSIINSPKNRQMAKLLLAMGEVSIDNFYFAFTDEVVDEKSQLAHSFDFYEFDIGAKTSVMKEVSDKVAYREYERGFIAYNLSRKAAQIPVPNGVAVDISSMEAKFCERVEDEYSCLPTD